MNKVPEILNDSHEHDPSEIEWYSLVVGLSCSAGGGETSEWRRWR